MVLLHVYSEFYLSLTESKVSAFVPSWNNILHGEKAPPPRTVETRKTVKPNEWLLLDEEEGCGGASILHTAAVKTESVLKLKLF